MEQKERNQIINRAIEEHNRIVTESILLVSNGIDILDGENTINDDALEYYDPNLNQIIKPTSEEDRNKRFVWVALSNTCLKFDLGNTKGFPPQSKCCPLRCRDWYVYLTAKVCHPSAQEAWDDIVDCLKIALATAGLGALMSGGAAAIAAFKTTFWGCMINKGYDWARDISLSLDKETRKGNWRRC